MLQPSCRRKKRLAATGVSPEQQIGSWHIRAGATHHVSALTGDGIDGFIDDLSAFLQDNYAKTGNAVLTRQRHRQILRGAGDALPRH